MATIYVDAARPDDAGNGLTPGTAKKTIRGAHLGISPGDTILVRSGQCHDSVSGKFFVQPNLGVAGVSIAAYGDSSDMPIWDGLNYEPPGSLGWTHVSSGVWKKVFGAWYVRRVFAGSRNNGFLTSERVIGGPLKRAGIGGVTTATQNASEASIVAALSAQAPWAPGGSTTSFALYIFTGSAIIPPPDFFEGLAFIQGDGASRGAVNHIELKNVANVTARDQLIRGPGVSGIRLLAANADSRNCSNLLFENIVFTHIWQNGVRVHRVAEAAPTWGIFDATFRSCVVDYATAESEQELVQTEQALSGSGDAFVADAGATRVVFDRCVARNPFHVGFAIGSSNTNLSLPQSCIVTRCRVEFDNWTSYSRAVVTYNGSGHKIERSLFVGQNVRSQFAGGVSVESNVWADCRRSIRKPDTSQWVALESYIFDSGAGVNDLRYIFVTPTDVKLIGNTVTGDINGDVIQLNSWADSFPVGDPVWPVNSVSITNNVVCSASSTKALTSAQQGGNAAAIPNPVVANNCFYNETLGQSRVTWLGVNAGLNERPGFTGNIEMDPMLTPTLQPMLGSPVIGAGQHFAYRRDFKGHQRPNPPSMGAMDTLVYQRTP